VCVCVDLGRDEVRRDKARRGGVVWCGRGYVTLSEVGCGMWNGYVVYGLWLICICVGHGCWLAELDVTWHGM
jgi:hypothetical protein